MKKKYTRSVRFDEYLLEIIEKEEGRTFSQKLRNYIMRKEGIEQYTTYVKRELQEEDNNE